MILSGISGLDLLIALKPIPTNADIPCCLLTSLDDASSEFRHLPASVPMVRNGAAFGDDFADTLAQLGITGHLGSPESDPSPEANCILDI